MNPLHWLAHILSINGGKVVSKRDDNGTLWMGFECSGCGTVQGAHKASDITCPVCGYYCTGNGGHGCIHKEHMQ